jgi:serine/threonine protein kinase
MTLKTIARYEIQSEIGRGGMAVVYLANDPSFERKVAIKLVSVNLQENPVFLSRFEREARLIARIEHPAIVPVYDFGEQEQRPYLVMRYMAGGSLSEKIDGQIMPLEEAAKIISQIAPALDAVHARGVVHRDLKPANILFDDFGNAAIADFGIAHLNDATVDLTGSALIGTPAYMSPEQVQGERELDGRSDVYALGVILFAMLTGQSPFRATTPMSVALKHLTEPIPSILSQRPDLPASVELVLNKALAKDREMRYSSASEMARALQSTVTSPVHRDVDALSQDSQRQTRPELEPPTSIVDDSSSLPDPEPFNLPPGPSTRSDLPARGLIRTASVIGVILIVVMTCALGILFLAWIGLSAPPDSITQPPETLPPAIETDTSPAPAEIILLAEDFSDPDSGWPFYENELGIYSYQPDGYRITVTTWNTALWATSEETFDNANISVDARPAEDGDGYYGVLCRVNNLQEYYYFIVHPDGSYSIGKYKNNDFEILLPDGWERNDSINTGAQTNHLRADCFADKLRFYVNHVLLAEITDADFSSGSAGFIVASLEDEFFEVTFSDLLVTRPAP